MPLLPVILDSTRRALSASFTDRPFEWLANFFLYSYDVSARTKLHNAPAASRTAYQCGSLEVWKRLRTTEPMSKLEQRRSWCSLVDAIHAPAHASSWQRPKLVRRMMDTIKEYVEKGFPSMRSRSGLHGGAGCGDGLRSHATAHTPSGAAPTCLRPTRRT